MGYSLRTRSVSAIADASAESAFKKAAPAAKKVAPAKKPAVPKKATVVKKSEADPKKTTVAKKAAPKKPAAAVKKTAASKKPASKAQKEEVKVEEPEVKEVKATKIAAKSVKAPAKAAVKKTTKAKPAAKKAAPKKAVASKKITIPAPVVNVEEVSTPPLSDVPEVEPICHEEPVEVEKVIEVVEGEVVKTHIRFTDEEEQEEKAPAESKEEEEEEIVAVAVKSPSLKEVSIHSSDFEALDEMKDDPPAFELYQSESEAEDEAEFEKKEGEVEEDEFDQKDGVVSTALQPVSNGHSAFEAFTSNEESNTFNWGHSGSTYYKEESEEKETEDTITSATATATATDADIRAIEQVKPVLAELVSVVKPVEPVIAPTVISNPFGFGFTTVTNTPASFSAYPATHFQSVSSPLDKLCNLTSQINNNNTNNNPVKVSSSFGSLSNIPSSYLPTSPSFPVSKTSKSPSEKGDKEERSPSTIQSIIVDDKHEDFSAF